MEILSAYDHQCRELRDKTMDDKLMYTTSRFIFVQPNQDLIKVPYVIPKNTIKPIKNIPITRTI